MKPIHRRHNPRHRHQGSMRRSISRLRLSHQSVNAPSNSIISPTSMKLTTLMIPPKRSLSIAPLQKPDVVILVRSILPSPPLNAVPTLQRRSRSADNFSKITNPQNVSGFSNQSPQRRNRQSSNLVVPTNLKPNIIPTTSMLRPMTLRTTLQSRPLKISNPQRSQPQPRQNAKQRVAQPITRFRRLSIRQSSNAKSNVIVLLPSEKSAVPTILQTANFPPITRVNAIPKASRTCSSLATI